MGDRANIAVKEGSDQVFLYAHWSGSELPEVLKSALIRGKGRWSDYPYLARIIFCEMVKGYEMKDTGFGISATVGDGDDRILTVDCVSGTVSKNGGIAVPFAAYIASNPSW
jgi:hypothetical protein